MVALTFELARSFGIIPPGRVFRVLAAIKLANETDLTTGEISEIAADRNLPPKMRALDRDAPQVFPEPGFSISRARAQAAAVGNLEAIELGGLLRRKDLRALKRQIDALR